MSVKLETSRLLLRTIGESHSAAVLDFVVRNRHFLAEWEPLRSPAYFTEEEQRRMLTNDTKAMEQGQLLKLWIFKRDEPERVIGCVSLSNIVGGAFQSCHLGYKMDQEENGKGFMTEAVKHISDYGFRVLKLHRIEANIMPRNAASLKVVEKLGFNDEGLARKYLKINGKWEDHIHMVLLNEELE
ncbi:GNAT family N-acetyltransferase [Cohnella candidum]|uniref:GNAT family N-acetyltransferase n=1 Tax=Cohnella candidum TaxID=2674991 RepID=A0A3G3JV36_9BACL|nr:GNAT family N-acetyltransferase [Cohnella candidum]AYQ72108.1 GNAT family N-acetyltransferase [Cohnella candidum]